MSKHQPSQVPARFDIAAVLAAAISLPVIALGQFISHARIDDIDGWFFLHYGRQLLEGTTLYADLWDIKPPGIFWINALGLWCTGGNPIGPWILCAIAMCASVALFYYGARQIYSRSTAAIGTIFAAVFFGLWTFHVGGNRPATFLILTEVACIVLYLKAIARPQSSNALFVCAGLCGGAGVWFKQTAIAASVAIILHLVITSAKPTSNGPKSWRRLASFALGYILSVGLLILILAITSDLTWAWDAIVGFNLNYFTPGVATSFLPPTRWMLPHLHGLELILILAIATLVKPISNITRRVTRRAQEGDATTRSNEPPVLLLFWMWMLAAIYLSAIGPHNRPMYLAVALPPLVMLATHSVHLLLNSARTKGGNIPAHYVFVGVLWFAYMLWTPLQMQFDFALRQYHWSTRPPDARLTAMVDAIKRHSLPSETMFACGYAPELYWRANRQQAIRYLGTEKAQHLHQHGQPLMNEITRCLQAASPRIIVFEQNRFGSTDAHDSIDASEFKKWVRQTYHQPERDTFPSLWVRKMSQD